MATIRNDSSRGITVPRRTHGGETFGGVLVAPRTSLEAPDWYARELWETKDFRALAKRKDLVFEGRSAETRRDPELPELERQVAVERARVSTLERELAELRAKKPEKGLEAASKATAEASARADAAEKRAKDLESELAKHKTADKTADKS